MVSMTITNNATINMVITTITGDYIITEDYITTKDYIITNTIIISNHHIGVINGMNVVDSIITCMDCNSIDNIGNSFFFTFSYVHMRPLKMRMV